MAVLFIQLNFDSINVSAQVGDIVYYSTGGAPLGGFDNTSLAGTTVMLGPIVSINIGSIIVSYDNSTASPPGAGDYISFVKDKQINTSSLLGYYLQADFVNNSKKKAELFSVGSEIAESSK